MTKQITRNIIVKADVEQVYNVWSNFETFPAFMKNIKSVKKTGVDTSHWEMSGPLGKTVEWDAYTTAMDENKRVGWSTKGNDEGDVTTSGMVTFNDLPHGETEVTVTMQYEPNKGLAGEVVDKLFANPEKQLEEDLSNFKSYIEGMYQRTTSK